MAAPIKILIADDDEDLELIEDAILKIEPQATLSKFPNGKFVVDFVQRSADNDLPDLIILDYNMPEMNGSQVLAFMSKDNRLNNIPKLVLSTSSAPIHIHECMANGAAEYFVKPNNMADLRKVAVKMLAHRRSD